MFLFQRLEDPGESSEVRVNHNDEVDRQLPFHNISHQDSREPISDAIRKIDTPNSTMDTDKFGNSLTSRDHLTFARGRVFLNA